MGGRRSSLSKELALRVNEAGHSSGVHKDVSVSAIDQRFLVASVDTIFRMRVR